MSKVGKFVANQMRKHVANHPAKVSVSLTMVDAMAEAVAITMDDRNVTATVKLTIDPNSRICADLRTGIRRSVKRALAALDEAISRKIAENTTVEIRVVKSDEHSS